MTYHYDTIIIGAGSMGMAAGYYLARLGNHTLLIDSDDSPHDKGSHGGNTRIIRHAYGEGREYVPLALRAQDLWNDLEKKSHLKIFTQVGSLGFGPKGKTPFIDEAVASGKAYDLEVESFSGHELRKRFPGLEVPDDYHGFYEPHSGFLHGENAIRAYRELATHFGAHLSFNNPVTDINAYDTAVEVHTEKGMFTARKLIVSAGAWTNKLTSKLGLELLPLMPTRQPVAWFEASEDLFNMHRFPTFMPEIAGSEENALYYGFPSIDGRGLKIGRHEYKDPIDPDTMNREFGYSENDESHLRAFLDEFMPDASGKLIKGIICIYTRTPDGHFIIDRHPEHDHVFIAAGFSGHGFKFASAVGEVLSDLVTTGETKQDISLFRMDRFNSD